MAALDAAPAATTETHKYTVAQVAPGKWHFNHQGNHVNNKCRYCNNADCSVKDQTIAQYDHCSSTVLSEAPAFIPKERTAQASYYGEEQARHHDDLGLFNTYSGRVRLPATSGLSALGPH